MVCIDSWQPDLALEAMAEHDVRWTMLVPTMALQLSVRPDAEGRLAGLTAMTVGGGPMNAGALGQGREDPRHHDHPRLRHVRVPRPHHDPTRRGRRDPARRRRPPVPRHRGARRRRCRTCRSPVGSVGAAQVRGPSLFVGYARDGRPSPPSSPTTGSCRPATSSGSTPTARSRSSAGRSRSSSAAAATSTSTRSRRPWRASRPSSQVCVVPVPDELLGERAAALVVSSDPDLDPGERHGLPGRERGPEVQVAGVRLRRARPAAEPGGKALAAATRRASPTRLVQAEVT